MRFTSLDAITRSVLQQRQLTIHYYLQYLKYAVDIFRELHFDTLRVVNARKLPVTDYGAVQLPADYVDFIKVGLPVGQFIQPLYLEDGLTRIPNLDDNGDPTAYGTPAGAAAYHSESGDLHINERGENIGRYYGFHAGLLQDTFKVLPERGIIQLNELVGVKEIVLEYISNGQYADACTKVDPLAQDAIETYMKWQAGANADNPRSAEAIKHTQALRKLRARKNPLTSDSIRRIVRSGFRAVR